MRKPFICAASRSGRDAGHPDDGIDAVAGESPDRRQRLVAEVVARRGEADPERIEDVQLGALDHRLGHVIEGQSAGEARERAPDGLARCGVRLRCGRFGESHRESLSLRGIRRPHSSTALWTPPSPCDGGPATRRCPDEETMTAQPVTPALFDFLRALRDNNERPWFEANKAR